MLHFRIRANPFQIRANPFQIQSVENIHPILGCYKTLHPKHPIWGVDGVFNPYLHILNIFSPNIIELLLSNSTTFQNQTQSSSNQPLIPNIIILIQKSMMIQELIGSKVYTLYLLVKEWRLRDGVFLLYRSPNSTKLLIHPFPNH